MSKEIDINEKLFNLQQEPKEELGSFGRRFLGQIEATEEIWGKLTPGKFCDSSKSTKEKERNKFLACLFLAGVDRNLYKVVVDELNNDFLNEMSIIRRTYRV